MKLTVATAVVAATMLAAAAAAQERGVGRSGGISFSPPPAQAPAPAPPQTSPVTPIQPAPAPAPDLFRAGPETYAPRFERLTQPIFVPYVVIPGYADAPSDPRHRDGHDRARMASAAAVAPPAPAPAPAVAPPTPVVRVAPRPYYLIPRCYAGDAPPRPAQLRPGCSMADLRRIDPPK